MDDQFGIIEIAFARLAVGEAGGMVGMHMGEQHSVYVGWRDAGGCEVFQKLATGFLHVRSAACFDEGGAALGMNHKAIDIGAPGRAMVGGQDFSGIFRRNIAQDTEVTVKIPVSDCGDDDVTHTTVDDTGDLSCWDCGCHGECSWIL
jgi:hypothetical protein